MSEEEDSDTEVRDFKEVLIAPVEGELPLVVGNYAVHQELKPFQTELRSL